MLAVIHTMHTNHDPSLVVLAGLLCAFGSWVASSLYRYSLDRPLSQAIIWHFLTAITAGIAIWCTHFIAILAYQPNAPVSFDLGLTFASLLVAIFGCMVGVLIAGTFHTRRATLVGGSVVGLAVSAMHYSGMIAYRVEGDVVWDRSYLIASVLLAIVLASLALHYGNQRTAGKWTGVLRMTLALTLAIVALHFTGMAAFHVSSVEAAVHYANPGEYKLLAMVIAGTAGMIVLGGFFTYFIEKRTRMEVIDELRQARDAAESASRAKSEFMSVLNHELRTPVTIVIGYASYLSALKNRTIAMLKKDEPISEAHFHDMGDQVTLYGQRVKSAGNQLLTIINDILDYTSIELNDVKLTKTEFAARDLLEGIAEQFEGLAQERSIRLHSQCGDITMLGDRNRCLQILTNLVGNAVKFSQGTDIFLRARSDGERTFLEVEDNGCGIDRKDRERIFQAFTQIEKAETRTESGSGLGLAICKKLAMAHGGDITVDSTLGKGTKFIVSLPSKVTDEASQALPVAA